MFRSALRAKTAENELAFANDPFAERDGGRLGHVVPLNVLHIAAAVADEVVMLQAFRIEARAAAFHRHFAHQTGLHQVTKVVISCRSGGSGVDAIDGFEDFRRGGMAVMSQEERHDGVTLRSASQAAVFQGAFNSLGVYQVVRLYLI